MVDEKDKGEFRYDFNAGNDEFYESKYTVREKELADMRARLEKVEKEKREEPVVLVDDRHIKNGNGKKKSTSPEDIENEIDSEIYRDILKKERIKKYDKEAAKEEEILRINEENSKNLRDFKTSKRRGDVNHMNFGIEHPKLAPLKDKAHDIKYKFLDSGLVKFGSKVLSDNEDSNLVKNEVPINLIEKKRILESRVAAKKSWNDTQGAKEESDELTKINREIRNIVGKNKLEEKKQNVELKKLDLMLNPTLKYPRKPVMSANQPRFLRHESQGSRIKGISLLGGGRGVEKGLNLNGTSASGRIWGLPNFPAPNFPASRQPQPNNKQMLEYVQNLHQQKNMQKTYEQQIQAQNQRNADAAVNGSIVNQTRQERIRGEIPQNNMAGQLPVKLNRTGFNLPSQMIRVKPMNLVMPRGNAMAGLAIRVPMAQNNRWVGQTPPKIKRQNNPVGNVTTRIAAGIQNMVLPFQSMAQHNRKQVFGAPTCKIRDINMNTAKIASNHHQGRSFGMVSVAVPKINIDVVSVKKKKKGMK